MIVLTRHGEKQTVNPREVPDHRIPLTRQGIERSRILGQQLGAKFLRKAIIRVSPYTRTKQTLDNILIGARLVDREGVREKQLNIREDTRLREIDMGTVEYKAQESIRHSFGPFFYRFIGGETPAECCDRSHSFWNTFWRDVDVSQRQRILHPSFSLPNLALYPYHLLRWLSGMDCPDALIVTHDLQIRTLVMSFFQLTVEQFESILNPECCDVITIDHLRHLKAPVFSADRWGFEGLRLR